MNLSDECGLTVAAITSAIYYILSWEPIIEVAHMPTKRYNQFFQSIRKAYHFDASRFVKKVLTNSLVFTPILFAYGFLLLNDSIAGAIYLTIAFNFGIVISSIIDCRYEMGFVWSNMIFIGCGGISLLIAVLIYPIIFGHPL